MLLVRTKFYCYDNRRWGLVIQGGSFVRFVDLVNGGTKPRAGTSRMPFASWRTFRRPFPRTGDLAAGGGPDRQGEIRRSVLETVIDVCQGDALDPRRAGLAYLKHRGISEDAIRELRLGFYPSCSAIAAALREAGHSRTR